MTTPVPHWLAALTIAGTVTTASGALAQNSPISLVLPLVCKLGKDCFIDAYVDHHPKKNAADYRCGVLTYNGNKGTDFRLRTVRVMEKGVPVLAAAAGTVRRSRDGMPDVYHGMFEREIFRGRNNGNGIVIDHGNGWRTLYGHLRRASILVKPGQKVRAGEKIALVGYSGVSEAPRLHFEVSRGKQAVDPFVGPTKIAGCGAKGKPLWTKTAAAKLPYARTVIGAVGFSSQKLTRRALIYGLDTRYPLSRHADNLLFHVDISGVYAGDVFRFRMIGPDEVVVFDKAGKFKKPDRAKFLAAGLSNLRKPLVPGGYRGEFIVYHTVKGKPKSAIKVVRQLRIR